LTFPHSAATRISRVITVLAIALGLMATPALASTGGVDATTSGSGGTSTSTTCDSTSRKAKLVDGKAIAPCNAPDRVKNVIRYANQIRRKPYVWGGGHAYPWSRDAPDHQKGYDCSGSTSWALHGGNLVSRPKTSGGLAKWADSGRGKWITIYANGGHVYSVIAGLRFDTAGGAGPRWHKTMRTSSGFHIRHHKNL
jgi:cell wall-associated NlpC family hydrolase